MGWTVRAAERAPEQLPLVRTSHFGHTSVTRRLLVVFRQKAERVVAVFGPQTATEGKTGGFSTKPQRPLIMGGAA